ncbi:MAG: SH3 domain-containing protein [Desulfobaccales bacterium]
MRKALWVVVAWILLSVGPVWAATMGSIGKGRVNVRSKPDLCSAVLFHASMGYPIQIKKQKNDWVYIIDWKHHTGWIKKSMVSKTRTAVVLADNTAIRKGPYPKKPVIKQASKGDIFKIFGEKGKWVEIGYYLENEVVGWVPRDLLWGD